MNNKRQSKIAQVTSKPFSLWRTKPPGVEQKELERLFNSNEIDEFSTPESVRLSDERFRKFSPAVFTNHFRSTKAMLGLYAMINGESNKASNGASNNASNSIPELGGSLSSLCNRNSDTPERKVESTSLFTFVNPPCWTWTYFDHEKNMDFVCVAIVAFCGSRDIRFEIADDGMQVHIRYIWPTAIYRGLELFQKARSGNTLLPNQHPKINSFVSHVLQKGITYNSMSGGEIVVQLPVRIQRLPGSWKKEAIQMNDTNIMLLEFSAMPKDIVIEDADTSIIFH